MKPITFSCDAILPAAPAEIASQILDLSRWLDFKGYGIIPGIQSACFEKRTEEIIGTQIRVTSTDDTSYLAVIVEWNPESRVVIARINFSGPLSALADSIEESWDFTESGNETRVTRTLKLAPKSFVAKAALYGVSIPLKRAIQLHLEQLQQGEGTHHGSAVR